MANDTLFPLPPKVVPEKGSKPHFNRFCKIVEAWINEDREEWRDFDIHRFLVRAFVWADSGRLENGMYSQNWLDEIIEKTPITVDGWQWAQDALIHWYNESYAELLKEAQSG